MIITNIDSAPSKKITDVLGIVRGNVVGSKPVSESFFKSLKKAMASTIALAPRIITGDEVGLVPSEEMRQKDGDQQPATEKNELEEYSAMLTELRDTALTRMINHAEKFGADGVINVRFDISVISANVLEVCAYGTAVKLA
ncbi:MAG: YbjQ family protein [PVC group bacterium]